MSTDWSIRREAFPGGEKLVCLRDGRAAPFLEVIAGWREDEVCRTLFLDALSRTPFAGFFWETPPISRALADTPYECVVIECGALAGLAPDPDAFAPNFERTSDTVATFANLGGDSVLVVPRPMGESGAYAHLAAFLRRGPEVQQHDFLQALGRATQRALATRSGRIWISTSGLGVAWLHARLDSRPKYYQFRPYRDG